MSLKEQVKEVLACDEQSRNSDTRLYQMLLYKHYHSLLFQNTLDKWSITLDNLYEAPSRADTQRYRAYWQNQKNIYLPTSGEVRRQRKINESLWREELSPSNPSSY